VSVAIAVESPASPQALSIVYTGLDQHNLAGAPLHDVRPLHVIASEDGAVVGGAVGRSWGECCELQQLWVATGRRGQGLGNRLMQAFEQEASSRRCTLVYLETFSFQAPGFYQALGYAEVLRFAGFTGGVVKHTMSKRLDAGVGGVVGMNSDGSVGIDARPVGRDLSRHSRALFKASNVGMNSDPQG